MTYPMERCGFTVQRAEHAFTDEVVYRVSKDGWFRYVRGVDWDEIGFGEDDEVFEAFMTGSMAADLRNRTVDTMSINT